jgi:hypothetical protein
VTTPNRDLSSRVRQPRPVSDTQLAILCRQVQWELDDAAHDSPAGRLTAQRREQLAALLESLAIAIRDSGGVVIETPEV